MSTFLLGGIMFLLFVGLSILISPEPINSSINVNNSPDFDKLSQKIDSIPTLTCPDCNCPRYEPVTCEPTSCEPVTVIQKETSLALDKFQFRYEQISENYYILLDKIEDKNDMTYCKENLPDLREELTLAYSYIADHMVDVTDGDTIYAYKILTEGNEFFDDYLVDVLRYCKDTTTKIEGENYLRYFTYMEYYNNITVSTELMTLETFKEIREYKD